MNCSGNFWAFCLLVLMGLFLGSCQQEVNINLETTPAKVVVQGSIENGQPPFVILSSTFGFFANIDLSTFENVFIHNAVVTVSDGSRTCRLKEYSVDSGSSAKFYIYSVDTSDLSNVIIGELGKTYNLSITYDGKTYTSQTQIPFVKGLDTLWFGQPAFQGPNTPNNAVELYGTYTDPDTAGNFVKYYTKRNQEIFYAGQLFSDDLVNGNKIKGVNLFAGYNLADDKKSDSLVYFYPGDSLVLKWCEIDKPVFNFWNTYQFSVQSTGNPFSSPINVKSNISNGAVGVWAGYGTIYYHMKVQ